MPLVLSVACTRPSQCSCAEQQIHLFNFKAMKKAFSHMRKRMESQHSPPSDADWMATMCSRTTCLTTHTIYYQLNNTRCSFTVQTPLSLSLSTAASNLSLLSRQPAHAIVLPPSILVIVNSEVISKKTYSIEGGGGGKKRVW